MEIEYSLTEINQVANTILSHARNYTCFAFEAEMGAGKTTIITAICQSLGVKESISSPSFSIINEYDSAQGTVYHIDLYRLKDTSEAIAAGVEDCIYSGKYCFIEWPGLAAPLLPEKYCRINIEIAGTNQRRLTIKW